MATRMNPADDGVSRALASYRRGDISAEIAVMRVLLALGSESAALERLTEAGEAELLQVARAHRNGLNGVASLVRAGLTDERSGGIEAIRAQFEEAVALAPEAAVALYSLGSPEILERATAEIVVRLREWRLVGADIDVLDIGCGIGRIEGALAPGVRSITGIDLSPGMIAAARTRCRGLGNVAFVCVDGSDLAAFAGRRFGLVLAVDAFPYLVAVGPEIAARHVADAAGLLAPGGAMAILNYSYRGDLDADRADIARLATAHGYAIERNGTSDLSLWDGATFLLRKMG
jgi:predicted TPR repeat methyltransferase